MTVRGVKPEDLYSLVLVSNPYMMDNGVPLYVLTTMQKDRYVSRLYAIKNSRSMLLAGGNDKSISCPKQGPDGTLAAIYRSLKKNDKTNGLLLIEPETGSYSELWSIKDKSILGFEWFDNDIIIAQVLDTAGEWKPYNERDYLDIDRLPILFNGIGWAFDRFISLYMVHVPSGRATRITPEGVNIYPFSVVRGKWLFYGAHKYELSPEEADLVAVNLVTGEKRVLVKRMTISGIAPREECDYVAVRGHFREKGEASHHRIYLVDCDKGRLRCVSCEIDLNTKNTVNSDVRGPSCTPELQWFKDALFFPVHDAGKVAIHKYTMGGSIVPVIQAGDSVIDEYFVSEHGTLYTLMTPTAPKELYLSGSGKITSWNAWIENRRLQKPVLRRIHRGDYNLDYWILTPPDFDKCDRCLPWILYIHGGPKTSFGYGFMFEFHALATRGYAVVYGNPRGSDGYTEDFADIRNKYGTIDYEDLMSIANDAVRRYKFLDKNRKAVAGGSYGGWMTNYIITKTDEFKAAITMRSCSNWTSFYGVSDIGWWFAEEQLGYRPWEDRKVYEDTSPLFNLDKVKTPTLIIHSTADYRCPMEQAIQLYTGLRVLGVKTKLALFPGETHDLMRSGTPRRRVTRLRLILEWLDQNLSK